MSFQLQCIGFVSLFLVNCGSHETSRRPSKTSLEQGATLGFEVVQDIFARNRCYQCHTNATGNADGLNLESYTNVKAAASAVEFQVQNDLMPKFGPTVSAADKLILSSWVVAGAPEFSDLPLPGSSAPAPVPDHPTPAPEPSPQPSPEPIDFATIRAEVFTPFCVRCHSGFSEYAKVIRRIDDIQFAVESNQMPKDSAPLPPQLKQRLAQWIALGAPETVPTSNEKD